MDTGLSTAPTDRETAERGIWTVYDAVGLEPPEAILWFESPLGGYTVASWLNATQIRSDEYSRSTWRQTTAAVHKLALRRVQELVTAQAGSGAWKQICPWLLHANLALTSNLIRDWVGASLLTGKYVTTDLRRRLRDQLCLSGNPSLQEMLRELVWGETWDAARVNAWNEAWSPLQEPVRSGVQERLSDRVWDRLWRRIRNEVVHAPLDDHLERPLWRRDADVVHCYGQFDAAWLCLHDAINGCVTAEFGPAIRKRLREPIMDGMAMIVRSCGFWMPYGRVVIAVDRAIRLQREPPVQAEDILPLQFADGWGLDLPQFRASQSGVRTARAVFRGHNPGRNRRLLEQIGLERFIRGLRARPVQQDEHGSLYRIWMTRDEPLVAVHVKNATPEPDGSIREFYLRVPPQIVTARAAVAWTFGLSEADYQPAQQS